MSKQLEIDKKSHHTNSFVMTVVIVMATIGVSNPDYYENSLTLLKIVTWFSVGLTMLSMVAFMFSFIRDMMVYNLAMVGVRRAMCNSVLHYTSLIQIAVGWHLVFQNNFKLVEYGLLLLTLCVIRTIMGGMLVYASVDFDVNSYTPPK